MCRINDSCKTCNQYIENGVGISIVNVYYKSSIKENVKSINFSGYFIILSTGSSKIGQCKSFNRGDIINFIESILATHVLLPRALSDHQLTYFMLLITCIT